APATGADGATRILALRRAPPVLDATLVARAAGVRNLQIERPASVRVAPAAAVPGGGLAVNDKPAGPVRALNIKDRLLVSEFIGENAPTAPVEANGISVAFEYCLVGIQRPWYADAFINQRTWWIPGIPKGTATATGGFTLLPIGVVAIRKLE